MALSKKESEKISNLVRSIALYSGMASETCVTLQRLMNSAASVKEIQTETEKLHLYHKWHDQAAQELLEKYNIEVIKYGIDITA